MERPAPGKNQSQAIIDLIESIALEQTSLAALIYSEAGKIKALVQYKDLGTGRISAEKLMSFQSSVKSVLHATCSMQILLHKKLETVLGYYVRDCYVLKDCKKAEAKSSITTAENNIVSPSVFSMTGNACETVANNKDFFLQGPANIEADISWYDGVNKDKMLAYLVIKDKTIQRMTALPQPLSIEYDAPENETKTLSAGGWKISGQGATDRLVKGSVPLADDCRFSFSIWSGSKNSLDEDLFRMVIIAENISELSHDSGVVAYRGDLQGIVPDMTNQEST